MALMWRLTKPLWVTGKTLIKDSGFCVLKGLVGMYDRGVYVITVTKKHRY